MRGVKPPRGGGPAGTEAAGKDGARGWGERAGFDNSESFCNKGIEEGPGTPRTERGVRGSVPGKLRRWRRAAPAARGVEKENRKRGGRTPGRS